MPDRSTLTSVRWHLDSGVQPIRTKLARNRLIVHVLLPLFVGSTIYVGWRSHSLTVFRWLSIVGAEASVDDFRTLVQPYSPPAFVLFSVPSALWAYAVTSFYCIVWSGRLTSRSAHVWLALACSITIGTELGQLLDLVPGTFDVDDLASVCTATLTAFALQRRPIRVAAESITCCIAASPHP